MTAADIASAADLGFRNLVGKSAVGLPSTTANRLSDMSTRYGGITSRICPPSTR